MKRKTMIVILLVVIVILAAVAPAGLNCSGECQIYLQDSRAGTTLYILGCAMTAEQNGPNGLIVRCE